MTAAASVLVGLVLSLAALGGLWALHRLIQTRDAGGPLSRRFLFGIRVTMLLFAGRALDVLTGVGLFRGLVLLAAALIPLAVLILTEGLLRRHAPRVGKIWIAVGTGVFGALAFVPDLFGQTGLWALLAFQFSGLALAGALVLTRDPDSLSVAENRAAGRMGFSLLLIMPLAAIDFVAPVWGLPLQPSGLAVLFLCWLAISLGQPGAGHGRSLSGFAWAVVAGLVLTLVLAASFGTTWPEGLLIAAAVLAVITLVAIWNEAARQTENAEARSLLRYMATGPDDATAFLAGLRDHPLVDGAAFLKGAEMDGLDDAQLQALFAEGPVLRRGQSGLSADGRDLAEHLFARFDATHILCVRRAPIELLALSMPDIATSTRAELELAAVARIATLMSEVRS